YIPEPHRESTLRVGLTGSPLCRVRSLLLHANRQCDVDAPSSGQGAAPHQPGNVGCAGCDRTCHRVHRNIPGALHPRSELVVGIDPDLTDGELSAVAVLRSMVLSLPWSNLWRQLPL